MKSILTFLFLILSVYEACGTAQEPDILFYQGRIYDLFTNPLEEYYGRPLPEDLFGGRGPEYSSSSCSRGYKAYWLIDSNRLYLIKLVSCVFDGYYKITDTTIFFMKKILPANVYDKIKTLKGAKYEWTDFENEIGKLMAGDEFDKYFEIIRHLSYNTNLNANLEKLFPDTYSMYMVFASWYTGTLRVPQGKMIEYFHMGYFSVYEKDIFVTAEDGNIVSVREKDNQVIGDLPENFMQLSGNWYILHLPENLHPGKAPAFPRYCFSEK